MNTTYNIVPDLPDDEEIEIIQAESGELPVEAVALLSAQSEPVILEPEIKGKPKGLRIPWVENAQSIINLGPAQPSALYRFAHYVQEQINSRKPLPDSPFIEWAAGRITGKDRQDLVIFIEGRRGSGKSYSALWIAYRLSHAIAKLRRGEWTEYFSLNNIATLEDTRQVMKILDTAGKYQVVIIDDCSLAVSNRAWNSPQNKNFNALLTVARTNRWILILTAPMKKHVDNQVREMCDINMTVYKSFHVGGFNLVKVMSSDVGAKGKEYTRRMTFHKKKISFWATFKPPKDLIQGYDKQRDAAARALNTRIVETGDFRIPYEKKCRVTEGDALIAENIRRYGAKLTELTLANKNMTINALANYVGMNVNSCAKVVYKLKLPHKSTKAKPKITEPVMFTEQNGTLEPTSTSEEGKDHGIDKE